MKKLLNTLYVTTSDAYLSKDGTNVVISSAGKAIFRIPIHNVQEIMTFGYQGASPGVMKLCVDNSVGLSFFSPTGKFIARMQGPVKGNVLLRKTQYETAGNCEAAMTIARLFIAGKIYNSRVALRRFARDYPDRDTVSITESAARQLKILCNKSYVAPDISSLRGIEGEAAAIYFDALPALILNEDPTFNFDKRVRRPPTDAVNALLSFGYSLLAMECAGALEGVGLDPACGFMHTLRPGRFSLALDLMEELRSYLVDRFVISLINNRQMAATDFQIHSASADGAPVPVLLTDNGRKKFLSAWQTRKKKEIVHPFLNEKMELGILPHIQASMLARYLRHDLDSYPVFLLK